VRSSPPVLCVVATVFTAVLAGCTTTEAGTATTSPTHSTSTGSATPSSTGGSSPSVDIPPPPRDLSLDGLDPCTLFTEAQQAELRINDVRSDDGADAGTIYAGMKACALDAGAEEPFISYDVVAVTDVDVSFWLGERRNADAELISIGGYPAAQFHIMGGGKYDCAIALGVAKNQHLHVEMLPISDGITGDQICQGSVKAAEMALQTLQTLR
jgi:hypothetical protein